MPNRVGVDYGGFFPRKERASGGEVTGGSNRAGFDEPESAGVKGDREGVLLSDNFRLGVPPAGGPLRRKIKADRRKEKNACSDAAKASNGREPGGDKKKGGGGERTAKKKK